MNGKKQQQKIVCMMKYAISHQQEGKPHTHTQWWGVTTLSVGLITNPQNSVGCSEENSQSCVEVEPVQVDVAWPAGMPPNMGPNSKNR